VSVPIATGADALRARDVALCRSLLYQALSLGFRPPTEGGRARLATPDDAAALAEAAALVDEERGAPAPSRLAARVRALAESSDGRALETLLESHQRIFGHTARGPVPPYETEYGEDTLFQKPQEMSDVAGFLSAFGLRLDDSRHERIDHVSCELEFLAFLARKEAHAIESGNGAMLEETLRATRLFLRDHLGRFLPSFARRVQGADPGGFYGRLAALASEFIRVECERHGARAGPEMLRLRLPIDDGAPMSCGVPGPCGAPEDADGGPASE
jgi:DMSO reductase family type II enzyme chaperone